MNNYYTKKYESLLDKGYSKKESLVEIYHIYLDNKNRKISIDENNKQFWTIFIEENINILVLDENFTLCLIKGLKENYLYSKNFIERIININEIIWISAIRKSKLFLKRNINFKNIKEYYSKESLNNSFFSSCDILYNEKQKLEKQKLENQKLLKDFGYLELLCAISLFMMKYTNKNIDLNIFQNNGEILTKILHDRLKTKDRRKRAHDDTSIKKFYEIIMPQSRYDVLDKLEIIFKSYEELYYFEENILATFCFDDNFEYKVKDEFLELNVVCIDKYKKWFNDGMKIKHFFRYFEEEAVEYTKETMSKNTFGNLENDDINKYTYIKTFEIYVLLNDIYGISETINISEDIKLPLFESLHSINSLRGLYDKFFLQTFLELLEKTNDWNEAWKIFHFQRRIKNKMRFPLIYNKGSLLSNGLKAHGERLNEIDMKNIENFFTFDLRNIDNKSKKLPVLFEKPIIKIDDYVFTMPFLLGGQNISTSIINNLINIHFERTKFRKQEVHESETKLSQFFSKNGFFVRSGYFLPDSEMYNIGDIDLICEKDGYLFILELKSTYIRTSFENIWNYKSRVLRKASNQLNKRKRLVEKLIKEKNKDFISLFKVPKKVFYWIIDTSFEYDHEKIDNNLKLSMFELMYLLNSENEIYYPNGFNINIFIDLVESSRMWNDILDNDFSIENINYKVKIDSLPI